MTGRLTYHTFLDYPHNTFISSGVIVPQAVYNADPYYNISASLARPRFEPLPPVRFHEDEELGFSLQDALDYRFDRLHDYGSMPFLSDSASRISCRILWPGYEAWSKSFHILDNDRYRINHARLAFTVARTVEQFMNDVQDVQSMEPRADWWIRNIPYHELYLLELRHVSRGSWQPVLRLRREII